MGEAQPTLKEVGVEGWLYDLVFITDKLTKLGIPYYLDSGTLIGAVREKGMIGLHKREIENHQRLIDRFQELENIYRLEKERNREHQAGHIKMVRKYEELWKKYRQ